jgi:hypothetical protein
VIRRTIAKILPLVVALLCIARAAGAQAGKNDAEAEALLQGVFETEYLDAKFDESLEKLQLAVVACEGGSCSPEVIAKIYVGIGTVLGGGLKDVDGAREAFIIALQEDQKASLLPDFITPEVEQAFNDARAQTGVTSTAEDEPQKVCREFPGSGPRPTGWRTAKAYFFYNEAARAQSERDWRLCFDCADKSRKAEDRVGTRYLAARCAEQGGLWIEAYGDYKVVASQAAKVGLYEQANEAKQKVAELEEKIPKLILRPPPNVTDLVVKRNGDTVAPGKVGGEIWVNPGSHLVRADGKIGGEPVEFEQIVDVAEFETATIELEMVPPGEALRDAKVMKCMAEAKTKEEFASCIQSGEAGSDFNVRIGFELSGYHDSDNVDVVTPALVATVTSPTSGWTVGGGFLVDVVTAASADILATASPRWTEVRYVPSLNGSYKITDFTFGLRGNMSVEPDYLATSVGGSVSVDLVDKRVTPTLAYEFGYDTSGRAGTSFDTFGNVITRHGLDAAVVVVVDKATFAGLSFTAVFEDGDNSKPYRYVPMFAPEDVDRVQPGFAIEGVNAVRQPERVLEQLPVTRQRYALAGRIAHRFSESTFRAEERLYTDSWGLYASTTDARYIIDFGDSFRLWPHARVHIQTAADFWKLAYASERTAEGLQIPALRTGDRELGPLYSLTGGGGARYDFGEDKSYALQLTADVVYSQFLDHLFVLQRLAYFGALGLEVEFE